MVESHGLEHAPDAVTQVQAEQDHREDIPGGDPPHAEAGNYVVIDVAFDEPRFRMDISGSKLQQMEDDKGQNDWAAPVHRARSVRRGNGLFSGVSDRTRSFFAMRKLYGGCDVQNDRGNQDDAHGPQHFANGAQKMRVPVELIASLINLEVSGKVANHKQEHDGAGYGHHNFLAVCRVPEAHDAERARTDRCSAHSIFPAFGFISRGLKDRPQELRYCPLREQCCLRSSESFGEVTIYYWCAKEASSRKGSRLMRMVLFRSQESSMTSSRLSPVVLCIPGSFHFKSLPQQVFQGEAQLCFFIAVFHNHRRINAQAPLLSFRSGDSACAGDDDCFFRDDKGKIAGRSQDGAVYNVVDRGAAGQDRSGSEHGAFAHDGAFVDTTVAAYEHVILKDDRAGVYRLEHAANLGRSTEMDAFPNLRAASYKRVRVHHCAFIYICAYVDIHRRHADHGLRKVGA